MHISTCEMFVDRRQLASLCLFLYLDGVLKISSSDEDVIETQNNGSSSDVLISQLMKTEVDYITNFLG